MGIVLGPNQYGKAENRVVRIYRDTPRHEIRDVLVSTALRGDFTAAHYAGDQSDVLPTDSQKQTCYAYAKEKGIGQIETYGLDLARHFVDDIAPVNTIAGVQCPVLVVHGRQDSVVPAADATRTASTPASPSAISRRRRRPAARDRGAERHGRDRAHTTRPSSAAHC